MDNHINSKTKMEAYVCQGVSIRKYSKITYSFKAIMYSTMKLYNLPLE